MHMFLLSSIKGMKCSSSLSVEHLRNSSAESLHHYRDQWKTLSSCQRIWQMLISWFARSEMIAFVTQRFLILHLNQSLSFFSLFFFPPVDLDPCDPGLSLSAGRSVMAEPDYMDEDCDELIKPKKLINPVKSSRNHQDLHRELLMNQKRSADRKIPWISLLAVTRWPHVVNPKLFSERRLFTSLLLIPTARLYFITAVKC